MASADDDGDALWRAARTGILGRVQVATGVGRAVAELQGGASGVALIGTGDTRALTRI